MVRQTLKAIVLLTLLGAISGVSYGQLNNLNNQTTTSTVVTTQAAPPSSVALPSPTVTPPVSASTAPDTATTTQTTTTQTTTQTNPAPAANDATQQASADQFQQWLQNNGYSQNSSSNAPPAVTDNSGAMNASGAQTNSPTLTIVPAGNGPSDQSMSFTQNQQAMLHAAPPSPPPSQDSIDAFNALMQQNIPLTPQQVVQLRQQIDVSQRAASIPANIPPKPVSSTLMVNLAPGTTPPAIRLAQGYVSSLVFVDSTGSAWPIAAFDIGNPKAVNIQWDGKSNVVMLQAITPYSDGDIVVRLVGLPTPITLELVAGQRVVDYRVDLHVSGIGPNTKDLPTGTVLPASANQLLLGVLDGVAPSGSKLLTVRGAECQAWLLGEKIYFRTRLTLLSPGWIGKMTSPDGMMAYEIPKTSSVLVSRYGEPAELKIEGF